MDGKNEREIINSLKCCQTRQCDDCFYQHDMDCMESMLQDAVDLLHCKNDTILLYENKIENGESDAPKTSQKKPTLQPMDGDDDIPF